MLDNRFEEKKIRNFYYLLAYAFDTEHIFFEIIDMFGNEKFNNIYDLFSIIICKCMNQIIKEGLYSEYINCNEQLGVIKGRVDILNTIRNCTLQTKNQVICNYDNYTTNNMLNKIIKTTIFYLLKFDIMKYNRINLKKIYYNLEGIDVIKDWKNIRWNLIKFNRLNSRYEFIIKICEFTLKNLIINKDSLNEKMLAIDEKEAYHKIFEKFVKNYLIRYYSRYSNNKIFNIGIKSENMAWQVDKERSVNWKYIPNMHTDITIKKNSEKENKVTIIDAKFYKEVLSSVGFNGYEKQNINRDNLYQIYSYISNKKLQIEKKLENKNVRGKSKVSGMLLYVQTDDVKFLDFEVDVFINESRIQVKAIDFTQEFGNPYKPKEKTIVWQMKEIAEDILKDLE